MERFISLLGLIAMVFLAWLLSASRKRMNLRLILSGVALQFILAVLILSTSPGQLFFSYTHVFVTKVVGFAHAGAEFVFGQELVFGADNKAPVFAFSVLPTIVFVSSLMAVLFHLGVLQKIVELMAKIMVYVMDVSGAESLATAANVFLGMAEAPLVIKPYIQTMTRSEIMAMMTGGMATISGALLATYASFGADPGHLLTASIISAPAALVVAKIMIPETETSVTKGAVRVRIPAESANVLDAACRGAADGAKLAISIAAMLICFIAFVALLNWLLSLLPDLVGEPLRRHAAREKNRPQRIHRISRPRQIRRHDLRTFLHHCHLRPLRLCQLWLNRYPNWRVQRTRARKKKAVRRPGPAGYDRRRTGRLYDRRHRRNPHLTPVRLTYRPLPPHESLELTNPLPNSFR